MSFELDYANEIIDKNRYILDSCFEGYEILGSVYRKKPVVNDVDILCKRIDFRILKYCSGRKIVKDNEFVCLTSFRLDDVKFHIVCCKKNRYFNNFRFIMKGPGERYEEFVKSSENKGYWYNHFGFIKRDREVSSKFIENEIIKHRIDESKIIVFETENKIQTFGGMK